ncbi:MAG: hypothetical protein JWL75_236 [Parcubacteria group bacterium]|nr:hypothetical protein [Parcubacteria group bacterium]
MQREERIANHTTQSRRGLKLSFGTYSCTPDLHMPDVVSDSPTDAS